MNNRFIKYIKNPKWLLLYLDNHEILKMSDKKYVKMEYKIYTKKKLNLDNPTSFSEKIQWLKINDHNPKYAKLVDKAEVKSYVSKKIGSEYIIPTIGVYKNFDDINFDELPNQFVIKCTHDSGGIVICKNKLNFNINKAKKYINKRMKLKYYRMHREWPYKNVEPRIIIEKFMEDKNDLSMHDYKFFCFNGIPRYCLVCTEREKKLKETFFDMNWNITNIKMPNHDIDLSIKKPINFEKMKELACILSENMPFIRVDFYEINGKIYFGELTLYPTGGLELFEPDENNKKLGDLIEIRR